MDNGIFCPICGNPFVAEFYDPRCVEFCLQCGSTFRRLRDRLATLGQLDPEQVCLSSHLADDLNMNSLDVVEFVLALEEEGIEIANEEAEEIETVRDAIRLANRHRNLRT